MSQEIILYDLPSKEPCQSWSGNVWKTRLLLNFKGIPYKTEWITYGRLQEFLKDKGLKPNPPGSWSDYSVPTIRLPDGQYVMDSAVIAEKIESLHPTPSLHLNPEIEKEASDVIGAIFMSLVPCFARPVIINLVSNEDEEWFKKDRASRFGMTVDELMREKSVDDAYKTMGSQLENCRQLLRNHKKDQGPFILGSQPSYADFYVVSTVQMFRQGDEKFFERFLQEAGPEMKELYEACEKWTERKD